MLKLGQPCIRNVNGFRVGEIVLTVLPERLVNTEYLFS